MVSRAALCLLALMAGPALADPVTIATARGPATVEQSPARVVVFDMAALDTLDALGVRPVGVPENTYLPTLAHVRDGAQPVGTLFEPDFEAVAALDPDLIVIGSRSATQYDALSRIAPTIDMTIDGATRLTEEAKARLAAYGTLFAREDRAAVLSADLDGALARARAAVRDKGDALVVLTNGAKMSVFGPGSRFGWLHDELGLPSAVPTHDEGAHGEAVSSEFIQKADPDWLIVIDRAAAVGQAGENARQTLDNPLVATTAAWKADHLVFLDPTGIYIANGGLRTLTGLLGQVAAAFGG